MLRLRMLLILLFPLLIALGLSHTTCSGGTCSDKQPESGLSYSSFLISWRGGNGAHWTKFEALGRGIRDSLLEAGTIENLRAGVQIDALPVLFGNIR